jgi:hypothetical protein
LNIKSSSALHFTFPDAYMLHVVTGDPFAPPGMMPGATVVEGTGGSAPGPERPHFTGVPPEILASTTRKLGFLQAKKEAAHLLHLERERRRNSSHNPCAPADFASEPAGAADSPEPDAPASPLLAECYGAESTSESHTTDACEEPCAQASTCEAQSSCRLCSSLTAGSPPGSSAQILGSDAGMMPGSPRAGEQAREGEAECHVCDEDPGCSMCEVCQCAYEDDDEVRAGGMERPRQTSESHR